MSDQSLWQRANEIPSLDLPFASTESLVDIISGKNLINFTRASTGTYVDANGVIRTAAVNEARFDHNPTTGESLGLLVEEQRTNSIRNNTMVGAVAGTPGTVPTYWVRAASPTNGISSQVVGTGTESGITYLDLRFTGTCSATFGFSVDTDKSSAAAAATGQAWTSSFYLTRSAGTIGNATVQLVLNEYSSVPAFLRNTFSSSVVPAASNLATQRITQTVTAGASTAFIQQSLSVNFTNGNTYDFTLRIGLPQLEQGAFATSVIPTSTAAATRSADVASITGANFSSWYRQDEGTVFAAGASRSSSPGPVLVLRDATSGNRHQVGMANASIVASNTVEASLSFAFAGQTRSSFGYALNNSAFVTNVDAITTDTASLMPTNITYATIGRFDFGGAQSHNGTIKRLTYWPQRLANSTLQQITEEDSMSCSCYNPKTIAVIPQYVVKATGDRFFIPAYPEPHTKAGDLASCKALSPKGVEKVA